MQFDNDELIKVIEQSGQQLEAAAGNAFNVV